MGQAGSTEPRHRRRPCTAGALYVPMTAMLPGGVVDEGGGGRKLFAGSTKAIDTPPCDALSTGVEWGLR